MFQSCCRVSIGEEPRRRDHAGGKRDDQAGPDLDVICIGRSSVDLYGEQVGSRLEEMASFAKYVGGCPTNISIGTARLGLKPGLITAVGDEHMGRFHQGDCSQPRASISAG